MKRRVALVEDDDVIRANYSDLLARAGFEVDAYGTKEAAISGTAAQPPELVLLDITMNGERDAGFDICAELRRRSNILPIVFLTSHDGEVDKISGLRLGADDYITKDVSLDYLIVRIETLFKRRDAQLAANLGNSRHDLTTAYVGSAIVFNDQLSTVNWNGHRVDLPLTQFWMLRDLYRSGGQVRSHADLMRAAKITVEPNTITAHIKAIRESFREIDSAFDCIRTERGRGYRWVYP
jgi:two-component system, OmpR family, response regulator